MEEEKDQEEGPENVLQVDPIIRNYEKSLIDESDLMITSEEVDLFPHVRTDLVATSDVKNKPVLITEVKIQDDVKDQDDKHVLDSLIEIREESNLDLFPALMIPEKTDLEDDGLNDYERPFEDAQSDDEKSSSKSSQCNEELWDTDLELDGEFNTTKDRGRAATYIEYCSKLDVVPAKYYLQNMEKPELAMKYHGLGPYGAKALAKSLESNITVDVLDLTGNSIHSSGTAAIGRMLEENNFITKMILGGNSMGDQGLAYLSKALHVNIGLRSLDVSDNGISDNGCVHIKDIMETNRYLLELNLSKNNIDSRGACLLAEGISTNDILESLDLSWNKIRGKGAIAVANGIKENIRIKYCDLSYNGFAQDGGKELADMIRDNNVLVFLNIEANRIDGETAALIGRALIANEKIEELKLGHNTMDTNGVLRLLSSINSFETSHLKCLHLTDIPVDFEIIKVIELIKKKRPEFKCIYGLEMMVGNTQEDIKKRAANIMNPIILLQQHVLIKDKRLIDILLNFDSDKNYYVTLDQFGQALQEMGVPFKRAQLENLQTRLDKFGNGTIYYGDFVPKEVAKTEPIIEESSDK